MELEEKYFLIVYGSFDRQPIQFDNYPSNKEIVTAIKELKGRTAKVEKRFIINDEMN